MSAADWALRQGRAVAFVALWAALAGLWVARSLPKGVYPEVSFPREQVVAELGGASAQTVQVGVTRPLEEALAQVPGVQRVRSRTIRGAAELSLFFAPEVDMSQVHPLVLAKVAEVQPSLPTGTDVSAQRVLPSGFPILSVNVSGPYPPERLYELAQYTLRPALSGLPGVGQVTVQSSDVPELQVLLDPERLRAAHLSAPQVADHIRKSNTVRAVARLEEAHELVLGVLAGELVSAEDVASVVVGGSAESPLTVGDLGRVTEGVAPRTSLIRVGGKPGVILNVSRRVGGDILTLSDAALAALEALRPALPPGVVLEPVYEQAAFVREAVRGVADAVLWGAAFAVLVLALFLRDWRATLLAALSLPLTLGAALLALRALGQTLNLMTLGGLAMSVGLVIDDAVVVIEAVHRHLEAGLPPAEAARRGTTELLWPVVGTTATTVVVFVPLGLLGGVAGQFFTALSLALASAVVLSLPVALLVLPALSARLLRPARRPSAGAGLARAYRRVLERALQRRWLVLGLAAALVLGGALLGRAVPTDFLPEADEGAYVIDYFAPVGASLEQTDAMAAQVEAIVAETPEVQSFSRRLGAELGPPTATLSSRGDIAVRLKLEREREAEEVMAEQRARIEREVPGLRVEFVQVLADMLGDLEGAPEPIEVKLFGPDPAELRRLASEAAGRVREAPGLVDFFGGDEGCAPEVDLRMDPLRAGRAGLAADEVANQLASAHLGEVATQVRRPDHLEGVRVRLDPARMEQGASPGPLLGTPLVGASGTVLPASALLEPRPLCAPAVLARENGRNLVHLTARLEGVSLGDAVAEVRKRLAGWTLPAGYTWELGGLYEQQRESFASLLEVLLVSVLAVAAVLLLQLRSARRSLAVLAATPVALAAGVATLVVTRVSLNVSSLMGAIVLVGLVVKNGILLLDYAQVAEAAGRPPGEALREAAEARLRPILMTTLATLVALVPLVIGLGAGAGLHRPLAVVVLGGLAFSTAATLFVVPALALGRSERPTTPPAG